MRLRDINDLEKAPHNGQYLIYTREEVLFAAYQGIESIRSLLKDREILELHLFDENTEFRALSTDSKRFSNGVIQHIVPQTDYDEENVYVDETVIEGDLKHSLRVVNYIGFTEEGMAYIIDYRLVMGE